LISFGLKLRQAFIQTREVSYAGIDDERNRFFMKVKEKMEEETNRMIKIQKDVEVSKKILTKIKEESDNNTMFNK